MSGMCWEYFETLFGNPLGCQNPMVFLWGFISLSLMNFGNFRNSLPDMGIFNITIHRNADTSLLESLLKFANGSNISNEFLNKFGIHPARITPGLATVWFSAGTFFYFLASRPYFFLLFLFFIFYFLIRYLPFSCVSLRI